MASVTSTITIAIAATVVGVERATDSVRRSIRRMSDEVERNEKVMDGATTAIKALAGGLAKVGAIGTIVPLIASVTGSLANLLPIALLLPGAILGFVAAQATFKLALSGFADAVAGDVEALERLAPSARETVRAVNDLKPAFDNLRRSVQQEFFKDFGADLRLISSQYLPILQQRLPAIAAEFNAMGRSVTRALTTNDAAFDLGIVLANVTKFLGNARNALGHFVSGFIPLAAVGSTYFAPLGTAIDGLADKFRAWSLRVTSDGSLRRMIDDALAGFAELGQVIGNIGDIIRLVFGGLQQGAGQDFLATLVETTAALKEFFATAEAQEGLGALGEAIRVIADAFRNVFLAALQELAPIVRELAPVFAEIARSLGETLVNALHIVGPLLQDLARFLNENKQIIADLAPLVIGLWAAFKGAAILTTVATNLRPVVAALGGLRGVVKIGTIIGLGAIAVKLNEINQAAAADEGRPLTDMEDNLADIVGGGEQLIALDFPGIFADIGDELGQLKTGFLEGTSPIGAFKDKMLEVNGAIADFAIGVKDKIVGFFTTDFPAFVTGLADSIGTFFSELPGKVGEGLSGVGDTVSTFFSDLGTSIAEGIPVAFEAVTQFFLDLPYNVGFALGQVIGTVQNWITNVIDMFANLPTRIGEIIDGFSTTVADEAQEAGDEFVETTTSWVDDSIAFLSELPGKVGTAIGDVVTVARDHAVQMGTTFLTQVTTFFNNTIAFLSSIPERVGSAISSTISTVGQIASAAGTAFLTGVTTFFNNTITFLKSVPGRIVDAIGYLGNLLFTAGKQLLDGLLNGIKAAYQGVLNFVSGIADGIASVKGPLDYDRIVLRPHGEALMSGLEYGIRTGFEGVLALTSSLVPQISSSLVDSATGIGTGASTGIIAAAREALNQLRSGGRLFEDFTFRGQSANLGAFNDALVDRFKAERASDPEEFLRQLVAAQEQRPITVNVDLDGEPVRHNIRVGLAEQDRESARTLRVGPGVSY